MDCSLSGSSAHGISQARILEWIAISFSRWSFWPRVQTQVSCTGRWILYHWATSEAKIKYKICQITFLFSTQELQSRVEMWKKSWGEGRKMEKNKVSSHNRETVQSGVGRTDSFIKSFAMHMSYQQKSSEAAASSCWLSSSSPSWGCQVVLEVVLPISTFPHGPS